MKKPFYVYSFLCMCVYICRQEVREGDFESKTEISLSCQPIAGKTIYSIYIPYICFKWIYTVYIYTGTVTVLPQSLTIPSDHWGEGAAKNPWGFNCPLIAWAQKWKGIDRGSFLCSQQHFWSSTSFFLLKKNENAKVKWIQVWWSRPQ